MVEEDWEVGFLLKRINDMIGRAGNQGLRPVSLTLTQLRMIMFLGKQPNQRCTQKDIEGRFGVSHPTIVGILKRLEAKELIQTTLDTKDRRRKEVSLTSNGQAFIAQACAHRMQMENHLVSGLSEAEKRALKQYLIKIYHNAQGLMPSANDEQGRFPECRLMTNQAEKGD